MHRCRSVLFASCASAVIIAFALPAFGTGLQPLPTSTTPEEHKRPEPTLKVGMPAPKFKVDKWIKGKPVERFDRGKVYVIEFWDTGCLPCRAQIPHLSQLQKDHPELTVIGVDAHEHTIIQLVEPKVSEEERLRTFVKEHDDQIAYTIAYDELKERNGVYQTWWEASGGRGVPHVLIVDGEEKIAFIGHPSEDAFRQAILESLKKAAAMKVEPDKQPAAAPDSLPDVENDPEDAPIAKKPQMEKLAVGSPAPALSGIEWIKGEAVNEFKNGHVYLLQMWDTNPEINLKAIPHLAKIHQMYKQQLTVIGIGCPIPVAAENGLPQMATPKELREYVDKQAEAMPYVVGIDTRVQFVMKWLARTNGATNAAFLIGPDGKIAWMGPIEPADGMVEQAIDDALKAAVAPQ